MLILTILLLLAVISLVSLIQKINNVTSANKDEDDDVTITTYSESRKVPSNVGQYIDFKEEKKK